MFYGVGNDLIESIQHLKKVIPRESKIFSKQNTFDNLNILKPWGVSHWLTDFLCLANMAHGVSCCFF